MKIDKNNIRWLIYKFAIRSGNFKPYQEIERQVIQREAVRFAGDIPYPTNLINLGEKFNPYRQEYKISRPSSEKVENLLYTPLGMGWKKNTLYERYSLRYPTTKELLFRPSLQNARSIPQGTVIQAKTPHTYGDWVSEHLVSLTQAVPITPPLLMPKHLMERAYVRRDLASLGIDAVAVEQPTLIHKAFVLHKQMFFHHWTENEVRAYRQAFNINPIRPRSGSIIYISREGEQPLSKNHYRSYPNKLTAEIMQELGAKVVFARETTYEDYCALAREAETVVADHGAAMFNLLLWNAKNVIELFSDQRWSHCFLFLTNALKISNHALIKTDDIERSNLRRKLVHHLDKFGVEINQKTSGDLSFM